jgi:hypothetical protein
VACLVASRTRTVPPEAAPTQVRVYQQLRRIMIMSREGAAFCAGDVLHHVDEGVGSRTVIFKACVSFGCAWLWLHVVCSS